MQLYSYWRSSAAYRVRVALHWKGLPFEVIPIHLLKDGGQQHHADYAAINAQELVPTLIDGEGVIAQSLAAIEYLEEMHPNPPLIFGDALMRAKIRQLAMVIACDTHPLVNLRVLQHLALTYGADDAMKNTWYHHWLKLGLDNLEWHAEQGSRFLIGGQLSMADCCMIPQLYNARRFQFPLDAYPKLLAIEAHCLSLEAFQKAAPEAQMDAVLP